MKLNTKHKAIFKYCISWFLVIVTASMCLLLYKGASNSWYLSNDKIFILGALFGMFGAFSYMLFIEAITPIYKYIVSKIKKTNEKFF